MAHDGLTRRTLIAGLAGAGAATLLRTPALTAAAALPHTRLSERWLGPLSRRPVTVTASAPVDLVGVQWTAPFAARIEVRARVGGEWGGWALASGAGHGPDGAFAAQRIGDPIWLGGADQLQLRANGVVRGVRLHYVDVSAGRGARAAFASTLTAQAASLRLAQPVLQAGPGQQPIVDREAWALGRCPPAGPAEYGDVRMAFVHHTENPNGYSAGEVPAMLRAIFAYHRYVHGWRDIGYNFVVDAFGRSFEARTGGIDEPVLGAQAGGYNAASTGIAVLGDFVSAPASAAAQQSLQRLIAWKLSLHGEPVVGSVVVHVSPSGAVYSRFPANAPVRLPRVAGHRDADSTSCPGDALYARLPDIRRAAHALSGTVLRATLATAPTPLVAPGPLALAGRLTRLDGSPVAGEPISLQSRRRPTDPRGPREVTVAQATTAADGSFGVSLPLDFDTSLRALHLPSAGLPATISDPVDVSVAPALTLTASSTQPAVGQPVTLSGTVAPAKTSVELDLWRLRPDGSRTALRSRRVAASRGIFSFSFTPSLAGTYQAVARTAADSRNAPGRSAGLSLVVGAGPPPPASPPPTS